MTRQAAYSASVAAADGSFSMTPAGVAATSTAQLATTRIERGGAALDFGIAGAVSDAEGGLAVGRGEVLERIQALPQGLELSWTFPAAPQGAGDVLVRVSVGGLEATSVTRSATLLRDPSSGAQLRVGQAFWVDAAGTTTALDQELSGGVLAFRVPEALLAASRFPAVLDPVVSPAALGPVAFAAEVAAGTINPLSVARFGPGSVTGLLADGVTQAIDCTPAGGTCSADLTSDEVVTLTATPASGAWFVGWSGLCRGTSTCSLPMSKARSVYAYFEPGTWPVRVVKVGGGQGVVTGEGISCPAGSSICTVEVPNNRPNRYQAHLYAAAADASSGFFGWSVDCGGAGVCTLLMDRPRTAYATLAPAGFPLEVALAGLGSGTVAGTLTATGAPAGISCASGATSTGCFTTFPNANAGAAPQVTLAATAGTGSAFGGWSGACSGLSATCTVSMDAARQVRATFIRTDQLSLSVKVYGNGTVAGAAGGQTLGCSATSGVCVLPVQNQVPPQQVTLTATPLAGALFAGWSGPCIVTIRNECTVTMDRAASVSAFFEPSQVLLSVLTAGAGAGTVTGPGIACTSGNRAGCSTYATVRSFVTLHAAADQRSVFAGWSGPCGGTGDCTVSLDQARTAIATFQPLEYTVRVSVSGSGSVTGPGSFSCGTSAGCSFTVPNTAQAGVVTLTASPSAGFVAWGGNCTGTGASCTLTVDGNKSVYATFQGTAPPPPPTYAIGGTASGVAGTLVLRNGVETLSLSAPGPFAFRTPLVSGATYAVSIDRAPAGQTCNLAGGSGTVGSADVTSVAVTCTTNTYGVSGTVSGQAGAGLTLAMGGETLAIAADATRFAFATALPYGAPYSVTVAGAPANQTCSAASASGTVLGSVTNVAVNCACSSGFTLVGTSCVAANQTRACSPPNAPANSGTQASADGGVTWSSLCYATSCDPGYEALSGTCGAIQYAVGGGVTGLTADGLVLQNNLGDDLPVGRSAAAFTFSRTLTIGTAYDVTVLTQPATETCVVNGGSGTVGTADVTSVSITCAPNQYTVSATVSGLSGSGLRITNTLDGIQSETLDVPASGGNVAATFTVPGTPGMSYAVTVSAQPTNPTQICTVTSGAGTLNASVSDVAISCVTQAYAIGGTVSGLLSSGLVLATAGEPDLAVGAGATGFTFAWPRPSGSTYSVAVLYQPLDQTCTVTSAAGTLASSDVSSVAVSCACNAGLLPVNGACVDAVQPRPCTPVNGPENSGTQWSHDGGVTWDAVCVAGSQCNPGYTSAGGACVLQTFTVGGQVRGLAGSGLVLKDNGGDALTLSAPADLFQFATPVGYGLPFAVTVDTQPASPSQTCAVTAGTGTVYGPVGNVMVDCTTNTYRVGGTIAGLSGTLVLRLGVAGVADQTVTNATSFSFPAVASGTGYTVAVVTQPAGQTCTVTGGTGTVGSSDVGSVAVTCASTPYTVGGTIAGLTGSQLTLALAANGTLVENLNASGTGFTFGRTLTTGTSYEVTVAHQPINPAQACTVANGSSAIGTANVASVAVTCRKAFADVDGGTSHAIGARPDGRVGGWGYNLFGQVGNGTTADQWSPVFLATPVNVSVVAAGDNHSLALRADGLLSAWGNNASGQLGDGTRTNRTSPVALGLTAVIAVAAGGSHTVALVQAGPGQTSGSVYVWGSNSNGQLALPTSGQGAVTRQTTPRLVTSGGGFVNDNIVAVAAGGAFTVVVRRDPVTQATTAWAWGLGTSGQLGNGAFSSSVTPVQVTGVSQIASVVAGGAFALARTTDGRVFAWGANASGQLGSGSAAGTVATPAQVQGGAVYAEVAAGSNHAVARRTDGTVWGWGSNSLGQLGTGAIAASQTTPVQVLGLAGVTPVHVAAGGNSTYVAALEGTLYSFGANGNGQLGINNTANQTMPFAVP